MTFEEYEREGRAVFSAFARTVAAILTAAIAGEPGFRLQQVKERAKEPASLRKKLVDREAQEKRPLLATQTLETEIKDLAGCRVIFYTNTDVTNLINSGLIEQNFEVLETKLHHPRREIEDATELYISNHYLVSLRPERIALPEYAQFAGLRCEVQIQTILNHAWAEMAHDTIYKQPEIGEFGGRAMDAIKARMTKVARRYLVPAGYEFAKIASDFQRLIEGKALFDGDALEAIVNAPDNNVRAEALTTFADNVLPLYDDPQPEYAGIVESLIEAVVRARETQDLTIPTPYGALPPKTAVDIVEGVADLLDRYRYLDIDVTFDALCRLYGSAESHAERKPLMQIAEHLAAHNIHVWQQSGPLVQTMLVEQIAKLGGDQQRALAPILIAMLREILSTEVSGSTSSSAAVTLHRGAVQASENLKTIRGKAISLLKTQLALAENDLARGEVLAALQRAARPPFSTGYSEALAGLVMESACEVIAFETEIAPQLSYELLQTTEARVHRLYRNYYVLPNWMNANPNLVAMRDRLAQAALVFRDTINADPEYSVYKTLVGFESVFAPAWDTDRFDYAAEKAHRAELVDALLDTIDADSAELWFQRLNRCAQTESNDMATFPVFGEFLNKLGETQPATMLGYIDRLEGPLTQFLPGMLSGVMKSAQAQEATTRIRKWVADGHHLDGIAWYLRFADPFDEALLVDVLNRAALDDDRSVIRTTLSAAVLQYPKHPGALIERAFVPAIGLLHTAGDLSWVRMEWFSWLDSEIIVALDEPQAAVVLDALVPYPDIELSAEHIVAAIATKWPARVMDFFGQRQLLDEQDDKPERYGAVPFAIHQLRDPLKEVPDTVLAEIRTWFDRKPRFFEYNGGRLLASTFIDLGDGLEERLTQLVADGEREDIEFVLAILNAFEGKPVIHALIRMIVARLDPDDELLRTAGIALEQSGVVSGEFGFAELHAERKRLIEPWVEDENERVREFARAHLHYLDERIAAEYRRAEASIAARRLNYGEDPDADVAA